MCFLTNTNRMSMPSVAVVILNWNGQHYLERFLPSVISSRYPNFSVVVADNASTDNSLAFLEAIYPDIRIIRLDKNEGFAKGYNLALAQVTADYYILLNSDVEVNPEWITPLINLAESDPSIAACQPKILSEEERNRFEYAGASGGWIDYLGYPFCRGRIFDSCEEDRGQYDDVAPVFWASGAALCIQASIWKTTGGFDDYLFAHQEEIDLCWRLQNRGYKIYIQPESVVYHVGGGSLEKGKRQKIFLNFRNNLIILHKNLPFGEKFWKIPYRLVLNTISAFRFLISGKSSSFMAVWSAHFYYFKWCFSQKKGSDSIPKALKKLSGVYRRSIVWSHFIRKKEIFSEIVNNKE